MCVIVGVGWMCFVIVIGWCSGYVGCVGWEGFGCGCMYGCGVWFEDIWCGVVYLVWWMDMFGYWDGCVGW